MDTFVFVARGRSHCEPLGMLPVVSIVQYLVQMLVVTVLSVVLPTVRVFQLMAYSSHDSLDEEIGTGR